MSCMKRSICCFGALILFFCVAFQVENVSAHSMYIQSSRYKVHKGKSSPLFFCYGHHMPVDDGVRAKKLKFVKVHAPTGDTRSIKIRDETCLHSYMVAYDTPGTYVLTAETNPGYYTMYIDKNGRKRGTIKPKSQIVDKAKEITKSLYSKQYTKTYVVCEEPSAQFPANIGMPLELVPTKDITQLKAGDDLELEVYFNGTLYEGEGFWDATYMGFSTEAEDNFHQRQSVTGSTLTIPIPNAGRWFVRYFVKLPAPEADKDKYTHMKHTSTLVFQIPNERKTPKADGH